MLNIGIIGVGKFGQNHARILRSLSEINFVGIYDKNFQRAKEIANLYKVPFYQNIDELIEKSDAVVIVVITTEHFKVAKSVLKAGKHIFIEKPITETYDQALQLIQIAERNNLKIQVGHIERFNPIIMETYSEIKNPIFIEAHRIAPFSVRGIDIPVVQELMIHDIDLILSFIDSKVSEIRAIGSKVLTDKIDIANARLEFENGAVANITASRISMQRSRKIRFFQKDSYISIDFQKKIAQVIRKSVDFTKKLPLVLSKPTNIEAKNLVDINLKQASNIKKDALTMELESFVNSIQKNIKPVVDGYAGARALKIATEIVEKIEKET